MSRTGPAGDSTSSPASRASGRCLGGARSRSTRWSAWTTSTSRAGLSLGTFGSFFGRFRSCSVRSVLIEGEAHGLAPTRTASPPVEAIRPADLGLQAPPSTLSRAAWLLARLGAMERGELRWRLGQALRTPVDVARGIPRGRLRAFDASRPPLLFGRDEAREIRDALPRQSAEVLLAAEEFAEGRFRFLGYPPVELERPIAFDRDPFTGKIWPARHGLLLDYRSASIGDPKWIWELNRLQHVPLLLAAALTADRDDLAAVAVEDATTWLDQAKPGIGIAWSNGYEPALRAISIALTLDGLRGGGWGTSQLRARLLESLGDHVTWVQRYPSLFSSANNHRLGELAAIVLAAATAPELDLATQSSAALNELEARCREQFASDGGNREQAFGYMLFSTELLVVVAGALRASGQELPAWLGALFASVGTALDLHLAEFDPEPRYGDSDDGGPTLLGGRL